MDNFQDFLRQLGERFNQLSQGKKVAALSLVALALASLVVMSLWLKSPDYQLLYANLSNEDAAAVVEKLKSQKVPYEITNNGRTIRVASDMIHEVRLQLASEGLPEGSDVGLEIFEDTPLGMTDFIQKLNFQRALQGELTRTINTLDAVSQARVHLVIPKDNLFRKEKPKGKASVTLKIKSGKSLSEGQIQGIVHLVSASVGSIQASDVVIVDLKGNLLSGNKESSREAMVSASNFKHKLRVEKELQAKIIKMLEEALGTGNIIAKVSTDLDFEQVERTEEIFDPDSQVVRSENQISESSTGATPPGGIPGVQGLVPNGEDATGTAGQAAQRNKSNALFNYEINKVVKRVSKPVGEITKLSVAVMIDGTFTGDPPEYKPRTQEEMDKYLEIVKSAVGFDQERGDVIKVENIQFDRSQFDEEKEALAQAEQIDMAIEIGKLVVGLIFLILFFTRVIRPIITWMTTTVEVVPEAGQLAAAEMEEVDEEKRRLTETASEATHIREAVADFVANDPKYTAGVIRKWMREKSPTAK
ncbi:MAG: flagellar basal-body MS-ring/collar protein FliF [Nitrospinota bacterium]|nr:flagellar basal-body MS-ring/collar protein FliF [Nitrospinota bacterium]